MILLCVSQREARPLNGPSAEARNGFPDLESGDRACQKEEKGGGPDGADGYLSESSPVADFRTKLRITRFGEKPQLKPKPSPGWIA